MGLGNPLGFTEKQVMGPLFVAHNITPSHKHRCTKHLLHHVCPLALSYAQQSSTRRPTDHDDKTWTHPGEFGRVQAWLNRTMRDLEMEREVHGHPPPAIGDFRRRRPSRNVKCTSTSQRYQHRLECRSLHPTPARLMFDRATTGHLR
jgi:hypothetical protein